MFLDYVMRKKLHILFGFGLVIGLVTVLCLFITLSNSKKHNKSHDYFDMSIEELMQIEITASAAQEKNHA